MIEPDETQSQDSISYEPPSITRVGSLAEVTKEGQRFNTDSRPGPNTAISFESQ